MNESEKVKEFYDQKGWKKSGTELLDTKLFVKKYAGKIEQKLFCLRVERIRKWLGSKIKLLEAGCGANPTLPIIDLCSEYTGIDFSQTGLEEANKKLKDLNVNYKLLKADICQLPFSDSTFDVSYTSHVLYHIPTKKAQEKALLEMIRVTKKGGQIVLIVANPRPLLFPIRLIKRLIVDLPLIGRVVKKLRKKAVLPYHPQTIPWTKKRLTRYGKLEMISYGLSSTYMKQKMKETTTLGKMYWKIMYWLELKHPKLSAYLGNYIAIRLEK